MHLLGLDMWAVYWHIEVYLGMLVMPLSTSLFTALMDSQLLTLVLSLVYQRTQRNARKKKTLQHPAHYFSLDQRYALQVNKAEEI